MPERPTLTTQRLTLRPFVHGDADEVIRLAGERAIAEMTLLIPHPYSKQDAEAWIARHQSGFDSGENLVLAITDRPRGTLLGAIGLVLTAAHDRADLGYWIGAPFWNNGYATEAGRAILDHAFRVRGLNKVTAHCFAKNPASGRVLEKIGMRHEGSFPQHVKKWGEYLDCVMYGLLRSDWERGQAQPG